MAAGDFFGGNLIASSGTVANTYTHHGWDYGGSPTIVVSSREESPLEWLDRRVREMQVTL